MLLAKDHCIILNDGMLDAMTKDDVGRLFTTLSTAPGRDKLVVHFHGGLINRQSGMDNAEHLMGYFKDISIHQMFFIWETGLLEVLTRNLNQIYQEPIFQQLLMRVTQFTHAKVT